MIDTIALTLDQRNFTILDPRRFSPSAEGLIKPPYLSLGSRGHMSCFLNPSKKDYAEGRYGPRLTLTKRVGKASFSLTLRVEFSAPKLLFGNNFDELRSQDFDTVVSKVRDALSKAGVRVSSEAIRAAPVSAVHYGKNIPIMDFSSCSMVMAELAKIDLSKRIDVSSTDYRNDGHALRYHTNTMEVVFYDKIKDLQQSRISEKRAIEKHNALQAELFAKPSGFPKQLEVLRMEVRLGNRKKIRDTFKRVCVESEPTFAGVFDGSVAKAVLQHFWADVKAHLPFLGWGRAKKPEQALELLAGQSKGQLRPSKLLQQVGYLVLVESVGPRGAIAALERHVPTRSLQRLKRELRELSVPEAGDYCALRLVDGVLDDFEPLRMSNFQTVPTQGSVA